MAVAVPGPQWIPGRWAAGVRDKVLLTANLRGNPAGVHPQGWIALAMPPPRAVLLALQSCRPALSLCFVGFSTGELTVSREGEIDTGPMACQVNGLCWNV